MIVKINTFVVKLFSFAWCYVEIKIYVEKGNILKVTKQ